MRVRGLELVAFAMIGLGGGALLSRCPGARELPVAPSKAGTAIVRLTLADQTFRDLEVQYQDGARPRVRVTVLAPKDVAGVEALWSEDQLFVYLPAFRRVHRLQGPALQGSVLGSDLRWADLIRFDDEADTRHLVVGDLGRDGVPVQIEIVDDARGSRSRFELLSFTAGRPPDAAFDPGSLGQP